MDSSKVKLNRSISTKNVLPEKESRRIILLSDMIRNSVCINSGQVNSLSNLVAAVCCCFNWPNLKLSNPRVHTKSFIYGMYRAISAIQSTFAVVVCLSFLLLFVCLLIIIVMDIYLALINAPSAHIIHINLKYDILYTVLSKTIYITYYTEIHTHTHTHTHTRTPQ